MNEPIGSPASAVARPPFQSLRIWPALVLVALMIVARLAPNFLEGGLSKYWMIAVFGPLACCLLMVCWWLFASRANGKERLIGFVGLGAGLAITLWLDHATMRGPGTTYLTLPMGMIAFAVGVAVLARRRPAVRTSLSVLLACVGFGVSLLLRSDGMTGDYVFSVHWRWSPTPEESMLAVRIPRTSPQSDRLDPGRIVRALANPEWPGFRGADRAGRSRGPRIASDWSAHPPRQLWKIAVGPAWSSFAVAGNLLFTQEQRGPMETVVCYDAENGREIWNRGFDVRFDEPLGGPGPRATPTLANGGLFTIGATGLVLRLDPATGNIVWQQDLKKAGGREVPMWGFSASPLVTDSVVIVYAGAPNGKGLLAFDASSGALRWSAAAGSDSYSSPQWNTIAGVPLVLLLSNEGLVFVDPATGKERLNYEWKFMNYRALQPLQAGDDTFLLPTGMNTGTRAIRITMSNGQPAAGELWTSRNLKPDFTDLVSHQGYVYGIDAGIFTCVDLKSGERKWKGGRYGKGQVLLLENSGLLLVAAEDGRVVLLRADPSEHAEVASIKALEGKTWNHPVVVGDRLYVRNAQEAAAYLLTLAEAR